MVEPIRARARAVGKGSVDECGSGLGIATPGGACCRPAGRFTILVEWVKGAARRPETGALMDFAGGMRYRLGN